MDETAGSMVKLSSKFTSDKSNAAVWVSFCELNLCSGIWDLVYQSFIQEGLVFDVLFIDDEGIWIEVLDRDTVEDLMIKMETFILVKVFGGFPTCIDFVFKDFLPTLTKPTSKDLIGFGLRPATSHGKVKL